MKEFKYVVTDNEGIHARPAGELVKLVKGFESTISIEKEGKKVDCRKLLALMGLGVKKGHRLRFTAQGADAEQALKAIGDAIAAGLGEGA
mgnify:FL=1